MSKVGIVYAKEVPMIKVKRALMEYKLEELTKRVDKHNNVVERTYSLEQKVVVQEEQIKVANHRISDLEEKENGHV